jgi:malate dehydrogenase (oxaloacetate-decarboxylating)
MIPRRLATFDLMTADQEREHGQLLSSLPVRSLSLEEETERLYAFFQTLSKPLSKYLFLIDLLEKKPHFFYHFVRQRPAEMLPFIYTPTVGEACQKFSHLPFRRMGAYISYPYRDRMEELVGQLRIDQLQIAVVTDGERILGLGDLGVGGLGISIGKLCLYSLFAGIDPQTTLPVILDVGTANATLLSDPHYLGWRHERIRGSEYDAFVDRFVTTIQKRFPKMLLQWEDLGKQNAYPILQRYRKKLLSFNDDIQGTAGVVVAAILLALRRTKGRLEDQKLVIMGAGSAGVGIADLWMATLQAHRLTCSHSPIYLLDSKGLLWDKRQEQTFSAHQMPYLRTHKEVDMWQANLALPISLQTTIEKAKPTILIGVSAKGGIFDQKVLETMGRLNEHPIILPLSNPLANSECTPKEAIEATQGRSFLATGTRFEPTLYKGQLFETSQCNNVYLFPGLGAGAIAVEARELTDNMIRAGVEALSREGARQDHPGAPLFPPIEALPTLSRSIAKAVALQAIRDGVTSRKEEEVSSLLDQHYWLPA